MYSASRTISPGPSVAKAFRFSSQNDGSISGGARGSALPDLFNGGRLRTSSTHGSSKNVGKGKERDAAESSESGSSYNPDLFVTGSPYTYEGAREFRQPEIPPSSFPKRPRQSLLVAASDALNFKSFGRRRKSLKHPPQPMVLSEVIEISAPPRRDEEDEERERLRDAAAQSIGLGPGLLERTISQDDSFHDPLELQDHEDMDDDLNDDQRTLEHHTMGGRSTHGSNLSISMGPSQPLNSRHRSGSLAQSLHQARACSSPSPSIPAFPSTFSSISPFIQLCSTLPKHYPPFSLLMLALSKQWKERTIVLSTPGPPRNGRSATLPCVSYLHLFRSTGLEERELERLEINEDSVVFITDEEVSGRRNLIKVGGLDVGTLKKELNSEENGQTMWLLQITDGSESQKWIAAVKSAILAQRSLSKGLGLPSSSLGSIEPRGDLDVMLSMRAQGLLPSPVRTEFSTGQTLPRTSGGIGSTSASESNGTTSTAYSIRSASPHKPPTNAVSALKGLFGGGNRPRSPSRATSIDSERESADESFASAGNNLMSMLRSNGIQDRPSTSPSSPILLPISHRSTMSRPTTSPIRIPHDHNSHLDRKIVVDREPVAWSLIDESAREHLARRASASPSLQPPPRKRPWTMNGSPGIQAPESGLYSNSYGNASASFGNVQQSHESRSPTSPSFSNFSFFGTPEHKPKAPSLNSVSTFASGERVSLDRSTSKSKRWSRQAALPKRLTPPSGPPPAIPSSAPSDPRSSTSRLSAPHPFSDRPSSSSSSNYSGASPQSGGSIMPSFSKRASTSSAYSISTTSTSHSRSGMAPTSSRPPPPGRMSMPPPPRPAPLSALPPTPTGSQESSFIPTDSPPASKTSFRESFTNRALRLSMSSPRDAPTCTLPPPPTEEDGYRPHRRSSSSAGHHDTAQSQSRTLYPIPASPLPSTPPFPPPTGPLPPTPAPPSAAAVSRLPSIKQRLRMLSAPTTPPQTPMPPIPSDSPLPSPPLPLPPQPSTPIGEPITTLQNDPNFLLLATPVTPTMMIPPPRNPNRPLIPDRSSEYPELTSLSPPPRRGSRQIAISDRDKDMLESTLTSTDDSSPSTGFPPLSLSFSDGSSLSMPPPRGSLQVSLSDPEVDVSFDASEPGSPDEENPLPLISHHGSSISLGIVACP
ncbi:hypothetical protein JAAARDRAFT_189864 [Jaapia argillacea MUCL 33604]|uniref:PH domain-containing protein n=1 Tax=Jaapia argillacea MUCL 33604 TaxID=933084 RepID=A0A067Q683_9AGAM|nr:hypothetical protein JAAARDRAFT_189864 [Jaapia argillacea MUCL 33604]